MHACSQQRRLVQLPIFLYRIEAVHSENDASYAGVSG
jgi:hypothetical protein